jgi:hypothetical protein
MRAIAQAVSRRLLTKEGLVCAQVSPCGICGGQSGTGQVFLRVLRFSPVSIITPLLHIHSSIIWGMDNGPDSGHSPTERQSHPIAAITTK